MYQEKPWLRKGHIQKTDAILQAEGEDLHQFLVEEERAAEPDPHRLRNIEQEIASSPDLCEAVYYAYAKAMSRRDREPLPLGRFNYHFFEGGSLEDPVAFGDEHRGFLLGVSNEELGIFTPTHFAPFSMRSGYDLFQELGESDSIPAVLVITEDLQQTLSKMTCWHTLEIPESLTAGFHTGEIFHKRLMYNQFFMSPAGQHLAMQAVAKLLEENAPSTDSPENSQIEEARQAVDAA